MVLTKTKAKADEAKKELEDGKSFKAVAKEYSIDEASKAQGGKLPDVSKGQQEKALDDGRLQGREGRGRRPGQDPVRLLRLRGHHGQEGLPAVAGAGQGDHPQPAALPARAEGARRLRQGLPRGVQGEDRSAPRTSAWRSARTLRRSSRTPARALRQGAPRAPGAPPGRRSAGRRAAGRGSAGRAPRRRAPPQGAPQQGAPAGAAAQRRTPQTPQTAPAAVHPDALARLDEITRRLRDECPWDREQDERSIVPHTVEEAYELADAAHSGDDAKLLDELGDVLFQVMFLSLLLEERGAGDLAAVADACREKLIRRHPHVFGEARGRHRGRRGAQLGRDQARGRARGRDLRRDLPETLPSTLYAKKVLKRARAAGGGASPAAATGHGEAPARGGPRRRRRRRRSRARAQARRRPLPRSR